MSDLTSLLLAVWHGDMDSLGALADWLEERADVRADDVRELHVCHVKRLWLPAWDDYREIGPWNESSELAIRMNLRLLFPDVVLSVGLLGWNGHHLNVFENVNFGPRFTQAFIVDSPSPAQAVNAANDSPSPYPPGTVELDTTSATALPDGQWEVRREFVVRNP